MADHITNNQKQEGAEKMERIERYGSMEFAISGIQSDRLTEGSAVFRNGEDMRQVRAFRTGAGEYRVRFMPEKEGVWDYRIAICGREMEGAFECVPNTGNNHGKVKADGDCFQYEDGERYIPFGTTCYAWIHQTEELQEQTLKSLSESPFNKIRMCVFPKSMPYNNNDPDCYPFYKKENGAWDVTQPDQRFWEKLDKRIRQLGELGIEADLILFHPYDRWGFAELSQEDSLAYLEYCIARLASYRNIWWSLANEYEMLFKKSEKDWDAYGEMLQEQDVYGHLISIHNIFAPYPKRDWMTHCSIQHQSAELDKILRWRREYQLPIVIDECGYEGDLAFGWGSLTAFEMVHRFWWTMLRGGFCTHGETFHREDEILWWAKGGRLYGESAPRIAFLKELLYSLPGKWHLPELAGKNPNEADAPDPDMSQEEAARFLPFLERLQNAPEEARETFMAGSCPLQLEGETWYLEYFNRIRPVYADLHLDKDRKYKAEVIDIWNMTRETAGEDLSGNVRISLPAKEGTAILVTESES